MRFEDYVEDLLDLQIALLSEAEIHAARAAWQKIQSPASNPVHPDMKQTVAALRARCARLVAGQSNAISKLSAAAIPEHMQAALIIAKAAVVEGRRILENSRSQKSEFISHAEMNSTASRAMNSAQRSAA